MAYRQSQRENCKIRVLAIERMLSTDRYINSTEILRILEARYGMTCERKTVYNDLNAIDKIIPLEVKQGKNGGYRIMELD